MSDFNSAIPFVLKHEGGWVNDPNDNGGATNWGVSLRYLISCGGLQAHPELDLDHDGKIDAMDIQFMTRDEAIAVYRSDWWDKYKYGLIDSQPLATKVLDMSVNMGPPRAHKIVQQSLVSCGKQVEVDGVLGPVSVAAINDAPQRALMHVICLIQGEFYRKIVAVNPTQEKFLSGWLIRSSFQGH